MKQIVLSLLVVAGVGFARLGLAEVVNNYWQATGQGLDGRWGDVDHWSLGHLPTDGEIAVIDPLRAICTSSGLSKRRMALSSSASP